MQGAHSFAPVFACGCCVRGAQRSSSTLIRTHRGRWDAVRSFRLVAMHVMHAEQSHGGQPLYGLRSPPAYCAHYAQ